MGEGVGVGTGEGVGMGEGSELQIEGEGEGEGEVSLLHGFPQPPAQHVGLGKKKNQKKSLTRYQTKNKLTVDNGMFDQKTHRWTLF